MKSYYLVRHLTLGHMVFKFQPLRLQIQSIIHDKHHVIIQRILDVNKWARHSIFLGKHRIIPNLVPKELY